MKFNIRQGEKRDLHEVLELIKELALYEKALDEVENNIEKMSEDGFGENPIFGFFVAESQEKIIGIALYYYRYSTWKGKCLYLEDLIVTERHRNIGAGKALISKIIQKAKQENVANVSWQVLDWNETAIGFYKQKLKAELDAEWINCKIRKENY